MTSNQEESIRLKAEQLEKHAHENEIKYNNKSSEYEKLKVEFEATSQQRNELSQIKIELEAKNKELASSLELIQRENESNKSNLEKLVRENEELRTVRIDNDKFITEHRIKNEHLEKEIKDKSSSIIDKDSVINTQKEQINQLKIENKGLHAK